MNATDEIVNSASHVCRFNRDGEWSIRRIEFYFRNTFRVVKLALVLFSRSRPYVLFIQVLPLLQLLWMEWHAVAFTSSCVCRLGGVSPALDYHFGVPSVVLDCWWSRWRRWCWASPTEQRTYVVPASRWQIFGRDGDVQKPSGTCYVSQAWVKELHQRCSFQPTKCTYLLSDAVPTVCRHFNKRFALKSVQITS